MVDSTLQILPDNIHEYQETPLHNSSLVDSILDFRFVAERRKETLDDSPLKDDKVDQWKIVD